MSYQLGKKSLAHEVHRIARNELEGVLKEVLTVAGKSRNTNIHEARKHFKQVRALIRLLRPAMGDKFYKLENGALRKAAQRMSPIRDAHVRVQTMKKLTARRHTRRTTAALARIAAMLTARLHQVLAENEKNDWCKQVTAETERVLCRINKWPVKRLTPKSVRKGFKAACGKARRALAVAREDPTDPHLHDLRKSVKDLWYDVRLLGGNRLPQIKALTESLGDLGEKFGSDHDFAMLVAARDNRAAAAADWQTLEKVVALHRPRLQRAAFRLAEKILAAKPGEFTDVVVNDWEAWRSGR